LEVSSSRLNGTFPKKIFRVPILQTIDLAKKLWLKRFFARISSKWISSNYASQLYRIFRVIATFFLQS
jgi:hypothetical protein